MKLVAAKTASDAFASLAAPEPRRLKKRYFFAGAGLVGFVLFVLGFVFFLDLVARQQPPQIVRTEGIVVLTGGKSRVAASLDILRQQENGRLLISGVHPSVSLDALKAQAPEADDLLSCCVDLGRRAISTAGNAWETRDWVESRGYRRIVLVTSNYHMPRSLAELRRALPETAIIAYPVVSDSLDMKNWWRSGEAIELLVSEYLKFLVSSFRSQLPARPKNFAVILAPLPGSV